MSTLKIATLLGVAGVIGVIVSVLLGKSLGSEYLLDGAFICLALAGVITMLHVVIGLWKDYAQST